MASLSLLCAILWQIVSLKGFVITHSIRVWPVDTTCTELTHYALRLNFLHEPIVYLTVTGLRAPSCETSLPLFSAVKDEFPHHLLSHFFPINFTVNDVNRVINGRQLVTISIKLIRFIHVLYLYFHFLFLIAILDLLRISITRIRLQLFLTILSLSLSLSLALLLLPRSHPDIFDRVVI